MHGPEEMIHASRMPRMQERRVNSNNQSTEVRPETRDAFPFVLSPSPAAGNRGVAGPETRSRRRRRRRKLERDLHSPRGEHFIRGPAETVDEL